MRCLVALSISLLIASCGPGDWVEVRSKEGRFSIKMPATPAQTTQEVETAAGPISLRSHQLIDGDFEYSVSFSDYPDEFLARNGPESILDAARGGTAAEGELLEESAISLGEHSGRYLVLRDPSGERVLQIRLLLVGRRLYQFGIVTPAQDRSAAEVARFLDAFALLQN
ncbi:MAG: hypothetical protein JRF15_00295 [Deltaproteobacteria bacterium]|jgi:hypothetical protein|nr:hypothetical protein [Deltaproteobacteria bacterium]